MKRYVLLLLIFTLLAQARTEIVSQWRGPDRDGVYPNENLLAEWPQGGPKLLWKATGLGEGYSSPAVTEDRVYVTALLDNTGYLFAFDHEGNPVWNVAYGPEWDQGHPGTRTTPTVVGDKMYLVSGVGHVVCLSTSGTVLWTVDMTKTFGAQVLRWGIAESPLVDDDRVICTPGGSKAMLAALDRHTGETVWQTKGNGDISAYCSPDVITVGNNRIIVTMTQKHVVGVDAETGKFLWEQPHHTRYDINPNTPLYSNGLLYTNSGYGTGSQMFELSADGTSIKKLWDNEIPDSQMAGMVLVDGYIYASGHSNRGWACVDWQSGELQWQDRDLGGKGPIIFSDGLIYIYSEKGDVALVNPNPQKFDVISSFEVTEGSGPHWAHPVIDNGRLYIRHGDVLLVYDISK